MQTPSLPSFLPIPSNSVPAIPQIQGPMLSPTTTATSNPPPPNPLATETSSVTVPPASLIPPPSYEAPGPTVTQAQDSALPNAATTHPAPQTSVVTFSYPTVQLPAPATAPTTKPHMKKSRKATPGKGHNPKCVSLY
jgi:hypothetical protein